MIQINYIKTCKITKHTFCTLGVSLTTFEKDMNRLALLS